MNKIQKKKKIQFALQNYKRTTKKVFSRSYTTNIQVFLSQNFNTSFYNYAENLFFKN